VKRGYRGVEVPQVCGVAFETTPAWIWVLGLSDWHKIYLSDVDELRLQQYHSGTWEFVKAQIMIIPKDQIPFSSQKTKFHFHPKQLGFGL
jgi:hypothetical protein